MVIYIGLGIVFVSLPHMTHDTIVEAIAQQIADTNSSLDDQKQIANRWFNSSFAAMIAGSVYLCFLFMFALTGDAESSDLIIGLGLVSIFMALYLVGQSVWHRLHYEYYCYAIEPNWWFVRWRSSAELQPPCPIVIPL